MSGQYIINYHLESIKYGTGGKRKFLQRKGAVKKRIPFDVSVDPFYSESNRRYLERIAQDVAQGKTHFEVHELTEVED